MLPEAGGLLASVIRVGAQVLLGAVVFGVCALALRMQETGMLWQLMRRRGEGGAQDDD